MSIARYVFVSILLGAACGHALDLPGAPSDLAFICAPDFCGDVYVDLAPACGATSDCPADQYCCILPSGNQSLTYECLSLSDCLGLNDVVACRSSADCSAPGLGGCCLDGDPPHCCNE